ELQNKETKTSTGIIIPDSVSEKPRFGKVLSMSQIDNPEIVVGDTVYFKEFSGQKVTFEGKEFFLIPYGDILAKVVATESI
ncbi:MAG: co-chaperone GroES, partial [Bacteroidales bacterium]